MSTSTHTLKKSKDAIHQPKNTKADGKYGIWAELITVGPDKQVICQHRLIGTVWENEQIPEDWKEGLICPIFKATI